MIPIKNLMRSEPQKNCVERWQLLNCLALILNYLFLYAKMAFKLVNFLEMD